MFRWSVTVCCADGVRSVLEDGTVACMNTSLMQGALTHFSQCWHCAKTLPLLSARGLHIRSERPPHRLHVKRITVVLRPISST